MGGFGSGRWKWYTKRDTAEESKRLHIGAYKSVLRKMESENWQQVSTRASWTRMGQSAGDITLTFGRAGERLTAWLEYAVTHFNGEKTEHHYQAGLTSTVTPWGSRRYWWTCPSCYRRCGTIYLPPGASVFACRQCHNLTYTTSQESHHHERFLQRLLGDTQGNMTPAEFTAFLDWEAGGMKGRPPRRLRRYFQREGPRLAAAAQARRARELSEAQARLREAEQAEAAAKMAKYARYLTAGELCEQSGLTDNELQALAAARLITPDRDDRYRPKLAGWAAKLATLLHQGWSLAEIERWARGRWASVNPRAWPPDRAAWQ